MLLRFTNTAILVFVIILTISGVCGLVWTLDGWLFDVHRAAGWGLIALIPWKVGISLRSLRRGQKPNFDRGAMIVLSVALASLVLVILGLGVLWAWRIRPNTLWLNQTMISWHWMLALLLILPFAIHSWLRWPRPKLSDFASRRGALKTLALGAAAVGGWWLAEALARA